MIKRSDGGTILTCDCPRCPTEASVRYETTDLGEVLVMARSDGWRRGAHHQYCPECKENM